MSYLQPGDSEQGRWLDQRAVGGEEAAPRERADLQVAMQVGFLKRFVEGRVFEWVMTISMVFMALEILAWPATLQSSAFKYILELADNTTLGIAVLMIGWSRISALMLNGQIVFGFRAGPFVRAIACVFSSVIWFQFVFALVQASFIQGHPAPGIPFWFMATIGELYVAYQTVKNA